MNKPFFDKQIIHNSSLACFILSLFIIEYESEKPDEAIDLPKLLLVLPLVWSQSIRDALAKRTKRSTLETILRETPAIKIDIEHRVQAYAGTTLQGLNLAASCFLIKKSEDNNFKANTTKLPKGSKQSLPLDMVKTTKQLAHWFSTAPTEVIYKLIFGIPNEVHH